MAMLKAIYCKSKNTIIIKFNSKVQLILPIFDVQNSSKLLIMPLKLIYWTVEKLRELTFCQCHELDRDLAPFLEM